MFALHGDILIRVNKLGMGAEKHRMPASGLRFESDGLNPTSIYLVPAYRSPCISHQEIKMSE